MTVEDSYGGGLVRRCDLTASSEFVERGLTADEAFAEELERGTTFDEPFVDCETSLAEREGERGRGRTLTRREGRLVQSRFARETRQRHLQRQGH